VFTFGTAAIDDSSRLSHRALPLIELLKAAARAECDVMWDKNNSSSSRV